MRSNSNEKEGSDAIYINDIIGGGVVVECSKCGREQEDGDDQPLICGGCEVELFYRPWFSW